MWELFSTVIYEPLYNALVFLISVLPGGDVGLAIIILTLAVKAALFPLAKRATQTQLVMKKIAPLVEEVKQKYKDNQQEQVSQMFKIYKEHRVHPLSGVTTILLQLPIVIGLYWVFFKGGLPTIDLKLLYSYIAVPTVVDMHFLGIFLGGKSIVLALLVGVTQFAVGRTFDMPWSSSKPGTSLKDDIMKSMHLQMKYMLPVMLAVFAYILSAAVALHWVVGNLFALAQDALIKRRFRDTE